MLGPQIPFSKRLNARRYSTIQNVQGFLARLLSLLENKGFVVSGFSAYELFLLSFKFRIVRKSRLYPIIKKSEMEKNETENENKSAWIRVKRWIT